MRFFAFSYYKGFFNYGMRRCLKPITQQKDVNDAQNKEESIGKIGEIFKYIQIFIAFLNNGSYIKCNRYEIVYKSPDETPAFVTEKYFSCTWITGSTQAYAAMAD